MVTPDQLLVDSEKKFLPETIWIEDIVPVTSICEGLKLIKRETVNFSNDYATDLLELEVFGPDRPINNDHVNRLLQAMKRGTFRWEQVQIIVCSCDRKTYRMNGQHTAWARLCFEEAGHNIPVTVYRYRASSEEDMRQLYASIDRGKPRTKANVIQSYLFESTHYSNMSKSVIRNIAEGLGFWLWGCTSTSHHDGDEVAYLLKTEHYDLGLKVAHYLSTCCSAAVKHLRRSPVYAAMFETFNKSQEDSMAFWDAVKTGANLSADDVRLKLRNHLMGYAVNAGRGGGSYKHMVPAEDMYGWCIQAWNSYRKKNGYLRSFKHAQDGKRVKAV